MRNCFTIEKIKETNTYRELVSKKEQVKINILETRISRERITHAFYVWKNQSVIPGTVKSYELSVVNDIIKESQDNDASIRMSAEEVIYYCEQGNPHCVSPKCRCNTIRK